MECHNHLNNCYRGQEIASLKIRRTSTNFTQFKKIYEELRGKFYDKKINRSEFGEGLWSNLMSFLESKE